MAETIHVNSGLSEIMKWTRSEIVSFS